MTTTIADLLDSGLADLVADAHQSRATTDPDQVWRSYRAASALAHQAIGLLRQHEDAASRREAIPAGPVAATRDQLTALMVAANTGTPTSNQPVSPVLARQIVAAGAAVLLEILDHQVG